MSSSFAKVLNEARYGIKLTEIAEAIAETSGVNARSLMGNLSKFQNGHRTPSKNKVEEIANALAAIRKLPPSKSDQLRDRMVEAAGYADARFADLRTAAKLELSESEERRRLRPDCHRALQTVDDLKEYEIQTILDHVGVSTMKLIIAAAERGEEIEVVQLQKISAELQRTAKRHLREEHRGETVVESAETVINAGRARILVDGTLSENQKRLLKDIARMIETALDA